ncbi:MAG: pyridoxine 5'-phosphate synthase [Proteobacteria bacterium]|nr:pyridoxine 5'-phosphate synthase [Pseudomonadota bacterium]MBU1688407.1 pyridoxine 5'-phosphate synthase [Pseudomonadota bacterium]
MRIAALSNNELSILLVNDPQMQELNLKFRGKDQPTNVLAFPMDDITPDSPDPGILGDIVISVDTAGREAAGRSITCHQRIQRLLIHGLVHLMGYDHERSEEDAFLMEREENKIILELNRQQRRQPMIQLAINVDHVATIRQARGGNEPDPVTAAGICELAGASGIVVHLREDRRHIQDRDVHLLRQLVKTKLNLEMGASEEIIRIALAVKPEMITLVPEKRKELTTEGGLDVAGQIKKLSGVVARMEEAGIPVSMFIDPDSRQIAAAVKAGAAFVEIHTGRYSDATSEEEINREFDLIASAAEEAYEAGLKVNAGHGLNYLNTKRIAGLATIEELSIGHAIMARAIFVGLEQAVREMRSLLGP